MPKILAENMIVLNSLLTPIYDYIHANRLKDEIPDIYADLNLYKAEIQELSTNVIKCLNLKQYSKIHSLNHEVIELKNKIDSSWMFTEWLKYTYLIDHSGSTLYKREYENYHVNSNYGARQDISKVYEIRSIKIIDDMKTKHQQQIIDYERNIKSLKNRINETTQEIEVSHKRICELENQLKVENSFEEVESVINKVKGFYTKFNPNLILALDYVNETHRKILNKLTYIKLPEIKGLALRYISEYDEEVSSFLKNSYPKTLKNFEYEEYNRESIEVQYNQRILLSYIIDMKNWFSITENYIFLKNIILSTNILATVIMSGSNCNKI